MPLDFVPSEDNNYGYPHNLIRCTENWEEAVRAYGECGRFILRRPDLDPAISAYTDRICTDKTNYPFLNSINRFEFKVTVDEGGHVTGHWNVNRENTPEILQAKANDFLDGRITFKLNEIFQDVDATPYIADLERGVRLAEILLGKGLMLFFRTKEVSTPVFHDDAVAEVLGINDGPSDTSFGARNSFKRLSDHPGIAYELIEGEKVYSLRRGDMGIFNIPHIPGESTLPGGFKLWAGAQKIRKLTT